MQLSTIQPYSHTAIQPYNHSNLWARWGNYFISSTYTKLLKQQNTSQKENNFQVYTPTNTKYMAFVYPVKFCVVIKKIEKKIIHHNYGNIKVLAGPVHNSIIIILQTLFGNKQNKLIMVFFLLVN